MQLVLDKTFDDYLTAGERTVSKLLLANGSLIQELRAGHRFFAEVLWAGASNVNPGAGVLAVNAHMLLLAGVRIAMSGHAGAIFPTLGKRCIGLAAGPPYTLDSTSAWLKISRAPEAQWSDRVTTPQHLRGLYNAHS